MRNEEQDVDEKCQQRYEQRREREYQQSEQVTGRVRGRVEMGCDSETEAYQRQERSYRVDDEDGGERMSLRRRQ
jgi:hypothetical protein